MERAFRSRRVVTPDGTRAATVLTKDGRITALEPHALPIERVFWMWECETVNMQTDIHTIIQRCNVANKDANIPTCSTCLKM